MEEFLEATGTIDCTNSVIRQLAGELTRGSFLQGEKAKRLFYFTRDSLKYDPFSPFFLMDHYRASAIIKRGGGYCVQKAVVLAALARAAGIPARLAFADIKNHLASKTFIEILGMNLFVFHGYVELRLEDRWVKVTPAFEKEICERMKYPPVEFNGKDDAVFTFHNSDGSRFVEYVRHHGSFADVPLERILKAWEEAYGKERLTAWKNALGE